MSARTFTYEPKLVDRIVVRDFAFEFPQDLDPVWRPDNPVVTHLFNGLSLVKPYLEPYLAKSTQAAIPYIDVPELVRDMHAFSAQESRHFECHRRLNEILKSNGYPELAQVEQKMARSYGRLRKKSLRTQLAYNAGFECMTNGFTNWMINKRTTLFAGGSPHVVSFFLMHAVEETEHKTVAFDLYMAYSGKYWPRALGVIHGSFHVLGFSLAGMFTALKKDRQLGKPRSTLSVVREVGSMIYNVAPYLLRALLPWHNPRRDEDPQWMKDWIRGYAKLPKGALLPLVDTSDPAMPVPFSTAPEGPRVSRLDAERRKGDRRRRTVSDVASVLGFPDRRVADRRSVQDLVGA
ncbi:MAG TPA: metal-dependent hydrolase [Burkholderiales bacterium]|nr:metal-dependent hydrolase [Burkholderiales bacterium]